jgi:membrane protease YdiL (CAAX protease family)
VARSPGNSGGLDDGSASSFGRYLIDARQPLTILVFLLPAVVAYELAAVLLLDETDLGSPLIARHLIATSFEVFGIVGIHLPAAFLVMTLLAQHVLGRHTMRVSPGVVGGMLVESAVWVLPLLVLAGVLGMLHVGGPAPAWSDAALAVGAGLYEELVFRLALIAGVHAVLVELCGVQERYADALALTASALVFAAYHGLDRHGVLDGRAAVLYVLAGLLLGWLFLTRGLGIAAGAHVGYDLAVLVALPLVRPIG